MTAETIVAVRDIIKKAKQETDKNWQAYSKYKSMFYILNLDHDDYVIATTTLVKVLGL